MINIEEIGAKLRVKFISERNECADRFEKSISKVKIMNFSTGIVKRTVKSGDKVQEIKMHVVCLVECWVYLWITQLTWKFFYVVQ